jgi:hypothetical protein
LVCKVLLINQQLTTSQAINYKTNALDNPIPGDAEAEPSDSSDDFAGGDSGEESEEELPSLAKGKRQKVPSVKQTTPSTTPVKDSSRKSKINKTATQTPKQTYKPSKHRTPVTPDRSKSLANSKKPVAGAGKKHQTTTANSKSSSQRGKSGTPKTPSSKGVSKTIAQRPPATPCKTPTLKEVA